MKNNLDALISRRRVYVERELDHFRKEIQPFSKMDLVNDFISKNAPNKA